MADPCLQLAACLRQTLSPDAAARKQAEDYLLSAQSTVGYPLLVLTLIASPDPSTSDVKQSAAVHFKNMIKNGWGGKLPGSRHPSLTSSNPSDDEAPPFINEGDRSAIKSNLVSLMCGCPGGPQVKSQLSEAISLVAAVDFPEKWQDLLPSLTGRFADPNPDVLNGVLLTLNGILKRFRNVEKSDALYTVIKYAVEQLEQPLLGLFKHLTAGLQASGEAPTAAVASLLECQRLVARIFYSLNWQDLPAEFDDHMQDWMREFAGYLAYENPRLTDPQEEDEAGPIEKLQSAIIENLNLYAEKYDDDFQDYLQGFTSAVWALLMKVTPLPKHDVLATTSIRFLTSLVTKQMHVNLFSSEDVLRQIIGQIVIPNIELRTSDVERFEEDPEEYIARDMEGSDTDTRRRCAIELLRGLCRHFEQLTTAISLQQKDSLIQAFAASSQRAWKQKDAAMHIVLAVSVKAESSGFGVSEVSALVDVLGFFTSHVLPELSDPDTTVRPVIKAGCIKFVSTFRNQFEVAQIQALLPLLIHHLSSSSVVIHTYAAACIEKIMMVRAPSAPGSSSAIRAFKFTKAELRPFIESMFVGFFAIIQNPDYSENEYVMKAVMRALSIVKEDAVAIAELVITKLTAALAIVCRNPKNPNFNHYLFESVAVLVKEVCGANPQYTTPFEALLFPPFQHVLQMDVVEFTPYVFQILAQLLEYHQGGLGDAYTSLFPPLLTPALWESKGNCPALTRLLAAYMHAGGPQLAQGGQLVPVLGIFQKLISSRQNETHAFALLTSITNSLGFEGIEPHVRDIFQILLMRLQQAKTQRLMRLSTSYFAFFAGRCGADRFVQTMNSVQPGLAFMILQGVAVPSVLDNSHPFTRMETRSLVVGLTALIGESQDLCMQANGSLWSSLVLAVLKLVSGGGGGGGGDDEPDIDFDVTSMVYDSSYSKLNFASKPVMDPFPGVSGDLNQRFVSAVSAACVRMPGALVGALGGACADASMCEKFGGKNPGLGLQELCARYGCQLV